MGLNLIHMIEREIKNQVKLNEEISNKELRNKLETEKLSLEESIALYEEAMKLSKELSLELNEVTKKVLLIQEDGKKEEF